MVHGIHARPGGGIGRHAGLKILFAEKRVRVRFPPRAQAPESGAFFIILRLCPTVN